MVSFLPYSSVTKTSAFTSAAHFNFLKRRKEDLKKKNWGQFDKKNWTLLYSFLFYFKFIFSSQLMNSQNNSVSCVKQLLFLVCKGRNQDRIRWKNLFWITYVSSFSGWRSFLYSTKTNTVAYHLFLGFFLVLCSVTLSF